MERSVKVKVGSNFKVKVHSSFRVEGGREKGRGRGSGKEEDGLVGPPVPTPPSDENKTL